MKDYDLNILIKKIILDSKQDCNRMEYRQAVLVKRHNDKISNLKDVLLNDIDTNRQVKAKQISVLNKVIVKANTYEELNIALDVAFKLIPSAIDMYMKQKRSK